jgi:hypothetical protein
VYLKHTGEQSKRKHEQTKKRYQTWQEKVMVERMERAGEKIEVRTLCRIR